MLWFIYFYIYISMSKYLIMRIHTDWIKHHTDCLFTTFLWPTTGNGGCCQNKPGNPACRPDQQLLRGRWWTWRQQRGRNSVPNTLKNTYYLNLVLDTDYPETTIDNKLWQTVEENDFTTAGRLFISRLKKPESCGTWRWLVVKDASSKHQPDCEHDRRRWRF